MANEWEYYEEEEELEEEWEEEEEDIDDEEEWESYFKDYEDEEEQIYCEVEGELDGEVVRVCRGDLGIIKYICFDNVCYSCEIFNCDQFVL